MKWVRVEKLRVGMYLPFDDTVLKVVRYDGRNWGRVYVEDVLSKKTHLVNFGVDRVEILYKKEVQPYLDLKSL